jgi:hypothetical protein
MKDLFRNFLRLSTISVGILIFHLIFCRLIAPIGYFTLFFTTVVLEAIERLGLPTLKGSPQGFPEMTALGCIVAVLLWWSIWLSFLYIRANTIKKVS